MIKPVFLWIDGEFTGLEDYDHLIEFAFILTDKNLNEIERGSWVINCNQLILEKMNPFVKKMHTESNLIELVKNSFYTYSEVEKEILYILEKISFPKKLYFAGNSVYMDVFFLKKYMPKIVEFMHYRIVDVSSLKIIINEWHEENREKIFIKKKNHRAIDDIIESINELKHYKKYFLLT